jgi:hypothetical protein
MLHEISTMEELIVKSATRKFTVKVFVIYLSVWTCLRLCLDWKAGNRLGKQNANIPHFFHFSTNKSIYVYITCRIISESEKYDFSLIFVPANRCLKPLLEKYSV